MEILDAGRAHNQGHPPASIRFGDVEVPNFRKEAPVQTVLGAEQKASFLEQLRTSTATWKIWGNTAGTLEMRADPQNLPEGFTKPWPGAGYATFAMGDPSSAYMERGEIYDFVRRAWHRGIRDGGRRSPQFLGWSRGKIASSKSFQPVGIAFITGSISAPGLVEAFEHNFPKEHPLRCLFVGQGPADSGPQPTDKYAVAARRAVLPGICEERRHRAGAGAFQS